MLSALPASDPFFGNLFTALDSGLTPWEFPDDILSAFKFKPTSPKPVVSSSSGSGDQPSQAKEKPVMNESNRVMEERKRRRMISNRESARRSRMRKQRHVENLRNQVNLFRVENRKLNNELEFLLYHLNRLRSENECLLSERTVLSQKLGQIMVYQQLQQPFSSAWPCNINVT